MTRAQLSTQLGMILRPLAEGDETELLRIHAIPEVVRWWDVPEQGFPWDEPESTRLTIVVEDAVADVDKHIAQPGRF